MSNVNNYEKTEKDNGDASFVQVEENGGSFNNDENRNYMNNAREYLVNSEIIFKNQKEKIEQTKLKQQKLKSKAKPHPKK